MDFGTVVTLAFQVLVTVAIVACLVRIIQKAGYSGWWVLLGLVPLVNLIAFVCFATAKWPVEEAAEARRPAEPDGGPDEPARLLHRAVNMQQQGNALGAAALYDQAAGRFEAQAADARDTARRLRERAAEA